MLRNAMMQADLGGQLQPQMTSPERLVRTGHIGFVCLLRSSRPPLTQGKVSISRGRSRLLRIGRVSVATRQLVQIQLYRR
jgi:hypothetical protein